MNNDMSVNEFMNLPTTVDFIIRESIFFEDYLKNTSEIKQTQTISGGYLIGYLDERDLETVIEDLGSGYISATPYVLGLLDRSSLKAAGIIQTQELPLLELKGQGVLIGMIDTGIDYTNKAFQNEDGTSRIRYIYDQTLSGATPPEGFLVGTEFTNEQINEALNSENPYEIVPQRDTVGHGTFLASIAAGSDEGEYIGAAPESELIVVKLRKARRYYLEKYLIPPNQENAFESTSVMIGIEYIIKKARELQRPVAICIGVGTNGGSHDGYSIFEDYITGKANLPGVCICCAAGNESQAGHHTQGIITKTEESQNIEINVGENAGDIYMSLWNGAADRLAVSVSSPMGELVKRVPVKTGTIHSTKLVLQRSRVIIEYYLPVEGSGGQLTVIKIINATPGVWTITVYGDIIFDGTFHAWLPITGFISPEVAFSASTPYYTIVMPATSIGAITCGAYNNNDNILYANSSWGPTRLPLISPDFVAPGVDVGGVFPNGYGTMSGTSVAAAIATGAGALLLEWGIVQNNDVAISTYQVRAFIVRGCSRNDANVYPNYQWGYGRLDLIQTFALLREL